jgi:hypothetical protein
VRIGAAVVVIVDDANMSADGEGFIVDRVASGSGAPAAAFPQAAEEAAAARV